ncbi:MAG: PVC-type heme-binding CxxCH protein [Bacteroidota bacterium]
MKFIIFLIFTLFPILINHISNPTKEKSEVDSFEIMEGFQIELVAIEPLVKDPVAMEIDEDGNWYVVEMPGYPLDLSKTGKVNKLIDTNGDGEPDKSIVFADNLTLPTGIMKWKKGIIVTDAPDVIYFEDTNGDNIADKKEVIITGFSLSNPQHNMNNPKFGLDNWIYIGHSGAINSFAYESVFPDKGSEIRYPNKPNAKQLNQNGNGKNVRFKPDSDELESLSGETQFGHTTDPWGHRFYTDNANHLFHEVIDARYSTLNPNLAISDAMEKIPDHGNAAEVFPITENPNHQLLTDVGIITSSCGITWYDGGAFGKEFNNISFIAEPVHNLVHADIITENGATFTGKRLLEKKEFLASKDPWFRPVNFYVGPDGALYIIDYYRQIVEHPEWMSDEINQSGALYNGTTKGRIYRVSLKNSSKMNWLGNLDLSSKSSKDLVELLKNNNGWYRKNAQRLLFQRNDQSVATNLENIISGEKPESKIPALWLLFDWNKLQPKHLIMVLDDQNAGVKENALQLADRLIDKPEFKSNVEFNNALIKLANDPEPRVRFQWLCSSAFFNFKELRKLRFEVLNAGIEDHWTSVAAIAASKGEEQFLFESAVLNYRNEESKGKASLFMNLSAALAKSKNRTFFDQTLATAEWWNAPVLNGLSSFWKYSGATFEITEADKTKLLNTFSKTSNSKLRKSISGLISIVGLPKNQIEIGVIKTKFGSSKDISFQEDAIALLALSKSPDIESKLINLITGQTTEGLQMAAVEALPENLATKDYNQINKIYKKLKTPVKKEWIKYLITKEIRIPILLSEIEKGNIPQSDLLWVQMVELMNYEETKIRAHARRILSLNEDRKAVVQNYLAASDRIGNIANGKKIFIENCSVCHQIKGLEGTDFGPDLSTLKSRNAHSIITEIINPNNSIADKYGMWNISLKNGKNIAGIITSEDSNTIFLKVLGGATQSINKADIKSRIVSKTSAMPNGLENTIKIQDMADLVAFIKGL